MLLNLSEKDFKDCILNPFTIQKDCNDELKKILKPDEQLIYEGEVPLHIV